jgi:hypothetical protein
MRTVFLLLFLLFLVFVVSAQEVVVLSELMKPAAIVVDKDRFYVVEPPTIYVYGLKDHRLVTQFGKQGEGPGEFMGSRRGRLPILIHPTGERLVISNRGRILYFGRDGQYIETRKPLQGFRGTFIPFGKGFVGRVFTRSEDQSTWTLALFDADLQKLKDIHTLPARFGFRRGNINPFATLFGMVAGKDRIYISTSESQDILVFDRQGNKLSPIGLNLDPPEITSEIRKSIRDFYRTDTRYQAFWERIKDRLVIPDRFPPIRYLFVRDNRLIVQTFQKEAGNTCFVIFDSNGTRVGDRWLPLREANPMELFPYDLSASHLYQLTENDDEEWELTITPF